LVEVGINERTVTVDYDGDDETFAAIFVAIEDQGYAVAGWESLERVERGGGK
jgi:copper chaperone CopZ